MTQPDSGGDAVPPPPEAPENRPSYPNSRGSNINHAQLAQEMSTQLGREVFVNYITPGQLDDEGNPVPSVVYVVDKSTGDDVPVDPAMVEQVLTAHVPGPPPPTQEEERTAIRGRASAATTLPQLKAAILEFMDTF